MKNEKGFTLVELLATVVILSLIIVIAMPKIMEVIEKVKAGSLEATAKLIARSAEKTYTEKEVLGQTMGTLNCTDVARIGTDDYEDCNIKYISDKAYVTIVGSGKFSGKYVNNATKQVANAVDYSGEILATTVLINSGDMVLDSTNDKNLRYSGNDDLSIVDDMKNYVIFNNELWRIIGIFNVSNGIKTEQRVKIIRNSSIGEYVWDSSPTDNNWGYGYNVWETLHDKVKEDNTTKADINQLLNEYYYGKTNGICYTSNSSEQPSSQIACDFSDIGLTNTAKGLIEDAVWNIGGNIYSEPSDYPLGLPTHTQYKAEREKYIYWSSISQTGWKGKVGLPYASDYGYSSINIDCRNNLRAGITYENGVWDSSNLSCKNNNWLYTAYNYWTLSLYFDYGINNKIFVINENGYIADYHTAFSLMVRPVVYLKSNVKIINGIGTSNSPYELSL